MMYWADFGSGDIWRANLDGTGLTNLVSGLDGPQCITLDLAGGLMYWTDGQLDQIVRANLDGTDQRILVRGQAAGGTPRSMALDLSGGKMYWPNVGTSDIRRANLDGSGPEILVQNLPGPAAIALDLAHDQMYWTDREGGDIRRANIDGTGEQTLITGLGITWGIALDLGAPGIASFFAVAAPGNVPSGTSFDVTVTATDPYGQRDVNYQGSVTFSTSDTDSGIVLPADYTFTPDDAGVYTFPGAVTLSTLGDQTITVTDTASGITRTVTITVVAPN
jgi:hypothetical protein